MKKYRVTIELDAFEFLVSADNTTEAKKKALDLLRKKDITKCIKKTWPEKGKLIYAHELKF